jgi:hypothetical protein
MTHEQGFKGRKMSIPSIEVSDCEVDFGPKRLHWGDRDTLSSRTNSTSDCLKKELTHVPPPCAPNPLRRVVRAVGNAVDSAGRTSARLGLRRREPMGPPSALTSVAEAAQETYNKLPAPARRQADHFEARLLALDPDLADAPGCVPSCLETELGQAIRLAVGDLEAVCAKHLATPGLPALLRISAAFRTFSDGVVNGFEQTLVRVLQAIRARCCSRVSEMLPLRHLHASGTLSGRSTDPTPEAVATGVIQLTHFIMRVLEVVCERCVTALLTVGRAVQDRRQAGRRPGPDAHAVARAHDARRELLLLRGTDSVRVLAVQLQMITVLKVLVAQRPSN